MEQLERRFLPLEGADLRADADGRKLTGYAAVFNQEAVIGGSWREEVAPGAYARTLSEHDIRALWNHDASVVLGRNKAGTLRLWEDVHGLNAEIAPPENEWGRPVLDAVKRGDVSGMSIAFRAVKQEWVHPPEGSRELPKRTIREARLYEVSPVTFPAFPSTTLGVRAEDLTPEDDDDLLTRAWVLLRCAQRGLQLTGEDLRLLAAARDLLAGALPAERDSSINGAGRESEEKEATPSQDLTEGGDCGAGGESGAGVPPMSRRWAARRLRELQLLGPALS